MLIIKYLNILFVRKMFVLILNFVGLPSLHYSQDYLGSPTGNYRAIGIGPPEHWRQTEFEVSTSFQYIWRYWLLNNDCYIFMATGTNSLTCSPRHGTWNTGKLPHSGLLLGISCQKNLLTFLTQPGNRTREV